MIRGTEMVQKWLHQLDPQLNVDDSGFCALNLDGYAFGLQLTQDDAAFFLEVTMKTVSADDRSLLYKALQANNFQEESCGGFFAVDAQRHALMYQYRFDVSDLDFEAFVNGIHAFVASVADLDDDIDTWDTMASAGTHHHKHPDVGHAPMAQDPATAAMPVTEATLGFGMLPLALFV